MKFKYLGTAAAEGFPGLFCSCEHCGRAKTAGGKNIRTRSQALVNDDLLIDFPADTYHHVLKEGLDLTKIRHIIITHDHEDHFYPPDLHMTSPPFAHGINNQKILPIDIYGNENVNSYAGEFENVKDVINFHEIRAFEKIDIGVYVITPLKAEHDLSQNCFIYIIEEMKDDIKFPREDFINNGKKILYGNDTGYFPEEIWDYLLKNHTGNNKFDFVSLDATAIILDWRQGHMGIACCAEVRDRLVEMGAADDKTVFCFHHFSHNGAKIYDELVPIAKEMGFIVSYDGMEVNI